MTRLLRVAEVEATELPPWAAAAYAEIRDKVLDDAFPCTFGTVAQRRGEILYAFISPHELRDALIAYTDFPESAATRDPLRLHDSPP